MNTRITAWISAVLLIGSTGTVLADHDYRVTRNDRAQYDYAKVVSSQPIINYVTVRTPVRECWEEMQYYTVDRRPRHGGGATLVGAMIGGVLGHQFGSGRGNDAATIAGTLIGAAVGSDASRQRYEGYGEERIARPIERCETRYQARREQRIDGYRVTYRYRGQKYQTEMPYDPGKKIRVRVDVRPAG
ncbi:MAG: glycine zipper 2TM domain-containing protein [Gammaproteobacteria bacterium]|nr:glycine zipper 2TM domain-containing protein [Gammaproteobacteria bacterium]MBU2675763.1 glycine zipper 2TM domain-containing protein [Gammaproteobacteria bacterium]NNL49501.1 glycine zipper 2TM domain-containing protein [Woeseiaceae bacterium]